MKLFNNRRDSLILLFYIISVLCIIVSLSLFAYFITNFILTLDTPFRLLIYDLYGYDNVFFLGGLYSTLWMLNGLVILFLAFRMRINSLKIEIESLKTNEIINDDSFEFNFIKLSREFITYRKNLHFYKKTNNNEVYNCEQFFSFLCDEYKRFNEKVDYLKENKENWMEHIIEIEFFNNSNIENIDAFDLLMLKYHYFINEYIGYVDKIINLFSDYYTGNKQGENIIFKNFDFVLAHVSIYELDFLKQYSRKNEFLKKLFMKKTEGSFD